MLLRDSARHALLLSAALGLATACGGGDDGVPAVDGGVGTGGVTGTGASQATGGVQNTGGTPVTGGTQATGGAQSTGGGIDPGLPPTLSIHELCASNGGVVLDNELETDDWFELRNDSAATLQLADFAIADDTSELIPLAAGELLPGEVAVFWADDEVDQGLRHLPFKLSSQGDSLRLYQGATVVDQASYGALAENESLARLSGARAGEGFEVCRYPSPGRVNGDTCSPPKLPDLDDETFTGFSFPSEFDGAASGLVINELSLRPDGPAGSDGFVELINRSASVVDLDGYRLQLSPHAPGDSWPTMNSGSPAVTLSLPNGAQLPPGARLVVTVLAVDTSAIAGRAEFEGVLTLFNSGDAVVVDRIDFMQWPQGAVLVRFPEDSSRFRLCTSPSAGAANACSQLPSRDVGERVRHLRTPGDLAGLSAGGAKSGVQTAKVVVDMEAGDAFGDVVHLLSVERWPLHYNFVRERIDGDPELDRCDAQERSQFNAGWSAFSQSEYFQVEGRRYLLGTLSHYPGPGLRALEYTFGDRISPEQMRRGFFAVAPRLFDPRAWVVRPQDATQVTKVRQIEGTLPLVGPNAPFVGVTYQGLAEGVGYGTLRFIPATELGQESLGPRVIVLTDEVPNDIPFVGGLITEAFQTPLAHVNILSQGRGTPNMALRDARNDTQLAPLFDQLVRLEVTSGGFIVAAADAAEAQAFWQDQVPAGPTVAPRQDGTVTDLIPLEGDVGLAALPAIGAKAAQLGELSRVPATGCDADLETPTRAFAIPLVHYLRHFERSGAAAFLDGKLDLDEFKSDPEVRRVDLATVRQMMMDAAVDPALLAQVDAAVAERYGNGRVRFRSSSNTEDLPGFNGAGIYTSTSAERGNSGRLIEDAMRTVWASLWNERAFDERSFARIDHREVAMGILVHNAFLSERANGVGISRNVLNPDRGDQHYYNLQFGEASVTNPAPGVSTESLVYQKPPRIPPLRYQGASSLSAGHVLSTTEVHTLACQLSAIHDHFLPLIDPDGDNAWFAMDTEFKVMGSTRRLVFKQARPYSFGAVEPVGDCRVFE